MSDTTPSPDEYLRKSLVQALRKERYGKLCRDEPSDFTYGATIASQILIWSMVVSLSLWLLIRIELSILLAIAIVVLLLLVLAAFAGATKRFDTAALVIFALWITTGIASYNAAGLEGLLATHALPFAIVLIAVTMWKAIALASRIPVLLPVALIVVFLPLLTQDLWVVGDDIGLQLVAVAGVALIPPLLFLAARFSNTDAKNLFADIASKSTTSFTRQEVLDAIKAAPRDDHIEPPDDVWLWGRLQPVYADSDRFARKAEEIASDLAKTFARQCTRRLIRLVIGITAFFGAFVYLLAWAAIPISTSSHWISHPAATTTVGIADWQITVPTTPYISVALLLAIVAGAAFTAFTLTEERYSNALSDVLVHMPAKQCVMLAIPYRILFSESSGSEP